MKTWDLSGMGGGYEDMCQRMLWRGVAYLGEVKPPVAMWSKAHAYANIYGVLDTEGPDLKGLEDAIVRPGDDCTGAMHQCVMGHLAFIHKRGMDAWHEMLAQHRAPERCFDYVWDGQ